MEPRQGVSPVRFAFMSLYDLENNAVRLLSAVTRREGIKTIEIYFKDWKNNAFTDPSEREIQNLLRLLEEHEITFLGLSVRASAYHKVASRITSAVRKGLGIPVLWGGTHTILCADKCIEEADMICAGEGETVIMELLRRLRQGLSIDDTPGLWLRRKGEVIRNALTCLYENIDELPFRDFTSPDKYRIDGSRVIQGDPMARDPIFQMMCSRGCPYNCAYCYNSTLSRIYSGKGRYYRIRSVESVVEELKLAKKTFRNLRRIKFDDEVFIFQQEWVDRFCELYPKEIGLPFEIFTEPKLVERTYLEKLKKAGLSIVYMGIQNTYRITEDYYDRRVCEDTIRDAGRIFNELGLDIRYQVIVDDPFSTEEDRRKLFDLLMDLPRPYELYLFSLTVFPNTALASKLLAMGLITEKDIEGEATKTFRQMRVSLNYPRPPDERFWVAMLVLISKTFIPRGMLKALTESTFLRRRPGPLVLFAQAANVVKMSWVVAGMIARGELTLTALKRWANVRSLITQ
jgi:radical SAM superfamily enzyme YgiQ (UPF0313 family)